MKNLAILAIVANIAIAVVNKGLHDALGWALALFLCLL